MKYIYYFLIIRVAYLYYIFKLIKKYFINILQRKDCDNIRQCSKNQNDYKKFHQVY